MSEQATKHLFQERDESASILREWWKGLEHDKGERAVLRRSSSPAAVVFSPAYHRLLNQLRQRGYGVIPEALAAVAGLAAHVKEDIGSDKTLAQQMASPKSGENRAKVSGLRFRRMLTVTQHDELYHLLIRVIRLLDR